MSFLPKAGALQHLLLMPSACAASLPGDSADGKRLHDANCMGCHDTGIYTRRDRLVQSLDALQEQLARFRFQSGKSRAHEGIKL